MRTKTLIINIDKFRGIDNFTDPLCLPPGFLITAQDVDIDDTMAIRTRYGITEVYSGDSIHSLWSEGEYCFFMDGTVLFRLYQDYSATPLYDLGVTNRVVFVNTMNSQVWATNNDKLFFISENTVNFPNVPNMNFKDLLPCGHDIEYYRGRLYVARDNVVYFSDPYAYGIMDNRYNYMQFDSKITMMRATNNGMYISTEKCVYFAKGEQPHDFGLHPVTDDPAIEGSGVKYLTGGLARDKIGAIVLWLGKSGFYMGLPDGTVTNITHGYFVNDDILSVASATVAERGVCSQYIVHYQTKNN